MTIGYSLQSIFKIIQRAIDKGLWNKIINNVHVALFIVTEFNISFTYIFWVQRWTVKRLIRGKCNVNDTKELNHYSLLPDTGNFNRISNNPLYLSTECKWLLLGAVCKIMQLITYTDVVMLKTIPRVASVSRWIDKPS